MKTGIQILHDVEHTLHAICICGRQLCLACSRRKEVRAYLDVADSAHRRRRGIDIELEVSPEAYAALEARSEATGQTIDEIVAGMVPA